MPDPSSRPSGAPVRRSEAVALAAVVTLFALLLGLWAVLVPPFQAPDEKAHVDSALHLAFGDPWVDPGDQRMLGVVQAAAGEAAAGTATLPAADRSTIAALRAEHPGVDTAAVDQMTQHPPTAYAVQAAVLRAVGFEQLRWDHALLVLRLVDAILLLPLPVLAWAAVRRLTGSPRTAVVGAAALLAVPELASIGASVTNDALTMTLGGVVTVLLVRVLTADRRRRTLLVLGIALGVLVVTKGTGLPAVPVVALALLVGPGAVPRGRRVLETVATLAVTTAVGGWWWIRNVVRYGTVQPDGYAAIRPPSGFPAGQGPSPVTFLDVSWGTVTRTFWGSFGSNAWAVLPVWLTVGLTVVAVALVAGWAFRRSPVRRAVVVLAVFPVLLLAAQTVTSLRAYLDTAQVVGTQGRYLFPAVVALVAVSAVAWRRLADSVRLPRRVREALPAAATALAAVIAGIGVRTAATTLVPTNASGYAVWSAGPLGDRAVLAGCVVLVVLGVAAVLAVLWVGRTHPVDADRDDDATGVRPGAPRR
jgi:hypothetical protein